MTVRDQLALLFEKIPPHVKIVAVSKTMPVDIIKEAYNSGQRLFGENKSQELLAKQPLLNDDIQWHFIGHLQSNKVKYIAPFISLIQSVDSLNLLQEINKEALKNNRVIDCLLQFHIATEETKFGLDREEAGNLLTSDGFAAMKNVNLIGVMGMASFTDDTSLIRQEFRSLKDIQQWLKKDFFQAKPDFYEVSMGMTGDYKIAIEEGSTMVRIGTGIFGHR